MKQGRNFLNTTGVFFGELFPNGRTYEVPPFQRDYSWTEDEWEDLWNDLVELPNEDGFHYMGAIVVREKSTGDRVLIDGQQRLATLSLLALAVLTLLREQSDLGVDSEANQQRFELLFGQFLGKKDPASLVASSRLKLNANDNAFFQDLVNFRSPAHMRALRPSRRLLWDGYQFFFLRRLRENNPDADGQSLSELLGFVAGGILFIEILVAEDQSAFMLFETMNARGVDLAPADLVKNYLFSLLSQSEIDIADAGRIWSSLTGSLRGADLTGFLRYSLASQGVATNREKLLRAVRSEVSRREHVIPFLKRAESDAVAFGALSDPYDSFWLDFPGAKDPLRVLRVIDVPQISPLLLAARVVVSPAEFAKLLKALVAITMRYRVAANRPGHRIEEVCNSAASSICKGPKKSAREVVEMLAPVFVPDREFRADFSYLSFAERNQRKLVTYILLKLEAQATGKAAVDFESSEATVEHILPENPADGWEDFDDRNRERFTFRLGNLTILEPKLNRLAANKPMEAKAEIYAQSQFQLTRDIASSVWNPAAIEQRQDQLAKLATAAWRL